MPSGRVERVRLGADEAVVQHHAHVQGPAAGLVRGHGHAPLAVGEPA